MSRKFSNNSDLFQFISTLIDELREINELYWVSEFKNAMSVSSLSGEILGALRLNLLKFQKTDFPKKLRVNKDVREAIKGLDKALGYWRPDNL